MLVQVSDLPVKLLLLYLTNDRNSVDPANGDQLKIWECYDNLPAQQWYYTPDNRIVLDNQSMIYSRWPII